MPINRTLDLVKNLDNILPKNIGKKLRKGLGMVRGLEYEDKYDKYKFNIDFSNPDNPRVFSNKHGELNPERLPPSLQDLPILDIIGAARNQYSPNADVDLKGINTYGRNEDDLMRRLGMGQGRTLRGDLGRAHDWIGRESDILRTGWQDITRYLPKLNEMAGGIKVINNPAVGRTVDKAKDYLGDIYKRLVGGQVRTLDEEELKKLPIGQGAGAMKSLYENIVKPIGRFIAEPKMIPAFRDETNGPIKEDTLPAGYLEKLRQRKAETLPEPKPITRTPGMARGKETLPDINRQLEELVLKAQGKGIQSRGGISEEVEKKYPQFGILRDLTEKESQDRYIDQFGAEQEYGKSYNQAVTEMINKYNEGLKPNITALPNEQFRKLIREHPGKGMSELLDLAKGENSPYKGAFDIKEPEKATKKNWQQVPKLAKLIQDLKNPNSPRYIPQPVLDESEGPAAQAYREAINLMLPKPKEGVYETTLAQGREAPITKEFFMPQGGLYTPENIQFGSREAYDIYQRNRLAQETEYQNRLAEMEFAAGLKPAPVPKEAVTQKDIGNAISKLVGTGNYELKEAQDVVNAAFGVNANIAQKPENYQKVNEKYAGNFGKYFSEGAALLGTFKKKYGQGNLKQNAQTGLIEYVVIDKKTGKAKVYPYEEALLGE